ncbi:MAG: hypothetical protein QUV04_05740 [Synechococcus sp. WH 8007]|nr:hypothetical protein [Synechococcus sp. WH 8007]
MTASCFPAPLASSLVAQAPVRVRPRRRPRVGVERRLVGFSALALMLVSALLLAPDQPEAQAEICQRHNGAAACRIW